MSREHEITKRAKEIFQLVDEYPQCREMTERERHLARYLVMKFLMEMELVEVLKTLEEG